jgi:hypothetical protein
MQHGRRLDDTCVDNMAACVAAAAGSSMMGEQQGHGSGVKINSSRASGYFVLGVLNTQGLRDLVVESTMSAAKKKQRQALDPAIIGAYDGVKTTPEEKLWIHPILPALNVPVVRFKKLIT